MLIGILLAGCAAEREEAPTYKPIAATVTPHRVRAFGYDRLQVTTQTPVFKGSPHITIAGNETYDLEIESPYAATFYWQGSPNERESIDIAVGSKKYRIENALEIIKPEHPAFERMVSIGASFGQGVMSTGFDQDTQIYAPSAQVARQMGAYFPLPLTKRNHIPFIQPEDFEGTCEVKELGDIEVAHIDRAIQGFLNHEGRLTPSGIRIDPNIQVQNASVGGETLGDVVNGAAKGDQPAVAMLEHLVYDPNVDWAGLFSPSKQSELDYAGGLNATLWMTIDIAGNDVLPALGSLDYKRMGDDAYYHRNYAEVFKRAGKAAYFFIADLPDITILPGVMERRTRLIAEGETPAAVDAKLGSLRNRLKEINAILAEEAKPYPNVVIVNFSGELEEVRAQGLQVGSEIFTVQRFGGFISLDDLHLTRVGYGMIANGVIDAINARLKTHVPTIDLAKVAAVEPSIPSRLREFGLTPENCP